jgi:hypothetical protein
MGFKAWFRSSSSRVLNRQLLFRLTVATAFAAGGCTVLVDYSREQCYSHDDCRARGASFATAVCADSVCKADPAWSCLGEVTWPQTPTRPATVTLRVRDLVNEQQPVPGLLARVCRKLDLECKDPVMSGLRPDDGGNLRVPTETNFDGYVEIRAPGYINGLYFFYPPIDGDRDVPNIPLVSPTVIAGFAQAGQKRLLLDRGHVMLGAYDCERRPAEGVRFASEDGDAETSAFYVVERIPVTNVMETDRSGRGGLINLRPGTVSILGDSPQGQRIARVSLVVRPSEITYTSMVPAPR